MGGVSGEAIVSDGEDDAEIMESEPAEEHEPSVDPAKYVSPPMAFKIVHPKGRRRKWLTSTRAQFPLSFLAAFLGLLSLALPWFYLQSTRYYEAFSIFRHIIEIGEYDTMYSVIVWLILAGSIICFITSLGSLLQMAGIVLFAMEFSDVSGIIGAGPFVAVAATLVGMISLILSPRISIPDRFVTLKHSANGGLAVNVIALSAFFLGLISMFTCWFFTVERISFFSTTIHETYYSQLSFLFSVRFDDLTLLIAGAILVFIGTVLCILTPLGSLLQLTGTCLAFYDFRSAYGGYDAGGIAGDVSLGAGFFIAVTAGVIGIWSMVFVRRITIPGRFVSGLLLPEATGSAEPPVQEHGPREEGPPSRIRKVMERVPRIARIPLVLAITLAVMLAALAVPYAFPLSEIEIRISNYSMDNLEVDVYIDGEKSGTGMASTEYLYIDRFRVTSGIHVVALDYAFSSDDNPHPDGLTDWSSSVELSPYRMSVLGVFLQGDFDWTLPSVEFSCTTTADGYLLTFDEIISHNFYGVTSDSFEWSDLLLVLTEGSANGVWWRFYSSDLQNSSLASHDYGTQYIGTLGLNCTATDILGNGEANAGDYLRLTVVEGGFSESAEYMAYLVQRTTDDVIGQVILSG